MVARRHRPGELRQRVRALGPVAQVDLDALEAGPLGELASGLPLRRVAGSLRGVTLVPPIDASPFFDIIERDLPTPIWLALVATLLILLTVLGYLAWTIEPEHYSIWRAVPFAAAAGAGGALLTLALAQRLTVWLESYWLAALVVTAGFDVLCDEGEEYARKLEAARVPVTLRREENLCHSFTALGGVSPVAAAACRAIASTTCGWQCPTCGTLL